LAGKGHEQVMLTKYGKREWSDKKVLEKLLGIEDESATLKSDERGRE